MLNHALKLREHPLMQNNEEDSGCTVRRVFEEQMGIDDSVLSQLLTEALQRGGDFADLYFEYSLRNSVIMEEGIIKNSAVAVVAGLGIRVVVGDQTGYAYSEDLQLKPMIHSARTAAAIAHSGSVRVKDAWKFNKTPCSNNYPVLTTVTDVDLTSKIGLVQRAEKTAKEYNERIRRVTVAMVDSLNLTQVVTSDEQVFRDTRPMFRFNVQSIAQQEDQFQVGTAGVGGRVGLDFLESSDHPSELGRKAAAESILLLGARQAPSGPMPVLLGPAQSGILLHEAVGHPLGRISTAKVLPPTVVVSVRKSLPISARYMTREISHTTEVHSISMMKVA